MAIQQPTIARRSLGIGLRLLREARKLTRADAAAAVGYSPQTVQRIEEGTQSTKHVLVKALCEVYKATPEQLSHFCGLAIDGSKRGWWQGYKDGALPGIPVFLENEQEASELRVLETEFIPGLLQTPEYLREVQKVQLPVSPESAEAVRALRVRRQELILDRNDPPRMWFLIGCAALMYLNRRPSDVKEGQIARILEVAEMPKVGIRVVADLHAAMLGSFNILTPGAPGAAHSPFVYIDAVDGCRYVEDHAVVSLYERTFKAVWQTAIPVEEYLG